LSPFGFWNDLPGTLAQFKAWGIPYITCLFFKKATDSANTPAPFLNYLAEEHPALLDPTWQRDQLAMLKQLYGGDRVLVYKNGFRSLAAPHQVVEQ
jgi:hypothetical protein